MSLLTNILPGKEKEEYFLTLGIEENRISAITAKISDNEVKILGFGESEFQEKDEVEAADIAVSTAEKNFPQNLLVKKTIFALPPTFLEGENIKKEYFLKLKKIAQELSLEPLGYVLYPEAIAYYLERKEESPPTLLLLFAGKKTLILSLIRIGKIENNIVVSRSESISSDFEKILTQFTTEILPSRIIIYDEVKGAQLEEIREELLCLPWHKHSSFLHTPKIEILSESEVMEALIFASSGTFVKTLEKEKIPIEEKKEEESVESFGFVREKITEEKKEETPAEATQSLSKQFSFLPKQDSDNLPKINLIFTYFTKFLSQINFSISQVCWLPFIFLFILFFFISATFFALLWFYPKISFNILVYPQTISQNFTVTFVSDIDKVDTTKNIFFAKQITEEITGEKSITTTGKTRIGEKAKGEITIYNKTTEPKTFPKGTTLIAHGLKFNLTSEVKVASASETGEGLIFGKTSAQVEASEIGTEGNLPSDTILLFKDLPQSNFYAKNPSPFSGGTQREISSVSSADKEKLAEVLTQELVKKSFDSAQKKLLPSERIIEKINTVEVINRKYSHEVGAESKELNLALSLKINFFVYKEEDLRELLDKESFAIPHGFIFNKEKTQVRLNEVSSPDKNGQIKATISLLGYVIPEIDKNQIIKEITGKSYQEAVILLSKKSNIGGITILEEKSLPFLRGRLPFKRENITINVLPR